MSFSYDELLPTDLDKARDRLGDTSSTSVLYSDEHITAVLDMMGSLPGGVAVLARGLVTRFARDPVRLSDDGSSLDFSARIPAWQRLADEQGALAAAAASSISFVTVSYGAVATDEYDRGSVYGGSLWP